jgi:hypothetical protein
LNVANLSITDLTVDNNGIVYVTDVGCRVFQFRYLASNKVDEISWFWYGDTADQFLRVAVTVDGEGRPTLVVATTRNIIEFDWKYSRITGFYDLNEFVTGIVDLQINSRMILLQSRTDYFFYKRG